ncbi:MAG: lamin tail domain-containing protein [Verrucomicrobiales bacterium]|nr:lamin tail domain-containing protein [Verrucomicrobiales bacterium]
MRPRDPSPPHAAWLRRLLFLGLSLLLPHATAPFAAAQTVVKLGTVRTFSSPADLDLEGEFIYAINFSADDPPRTVRGVVFTPDTTPPRGATLVGPQSVVSWQNRPNFGSSADAVQLAEIMHDIRWANAGSGERLRASLAVTPGEEYQLQILLSANSSENRRWDIRINGREAVDELSSLGLQPGPDYSPSRAVVFTYVLTAPTAVLSVEMGDLFGTNNGGDRNPIWQALTLERLTVPPTPDDLRLTTPRLFLAHQGPVAGIHVLDRKSVASHTLGLVPGEGDRDNARFALAGTNLVPGPLGFSNVAPGTTFSFRLRAHDTAVPERALERSFTLTLREGAPPSRISRDATTLSTQAASGATVAQLQTDDPDAFDVPAYELVEGPGATDNARFQVSGDRLVLRDAPPRGTETVSVRLRATDQSQRAAETVFTFLRQPPQVRLSEVVATGIAGVLNEFAEPTEWLELHNHADQYESLAGWQLADSRLSTNRWSFPPTELSPLAHLVVLADGLGVAPEGSPLLHASFSLSADGEWLGLFAAGVPDPVDVLEFPALFPGVAFGWSSTGIQGFLPLPTPGASNGPAATYGENTLSFSRARGFVEDAFDLEITASVPGSRIRYTIDGTLPTTSNGLLYTGPIPVSPSSLGPTRGVRTIRALAIHPEAAYARVVTHTYFFLHGAANAPSSSLTNQSRLNQGITRHPVYGPLLDDALLALPALAVTLPQGLSTAERLASLELIDPSQAETGFQADCGLAATGTTSLGSPKLSMAARFRSQYGLPRLRYPVFARGSLAGAGAATDFKELRLRSHSHDTFYWLGTREDPPTPYGNPPVTRSGDAQLVRNLWMEETQLLMGQPGKHGRQVHLFLNGSYHGIYHVQEHADHDFMASYFPGSDQDFHFTGAALSGSSHGPADPWQATWSQVKSSLTSEAQARRWIDVTNLCDYMVLSFYAGNDWDWTAQHNWSAAGPKEPDRGGWKFFQQDSDVALQDVNANCTDQDVPDGLFTALMRYPDFRVLFRDRVQRHGFGDGVLTPLRAGAHYDARMQELSTAIIAESARWQPNSSVAALPWDRDQEWINEWRYLRETFFPQRMNRLLPQLRQHAGWWPADAPTFVPSSGRVPEGTAVRLTSGSPNGTVYYTTDGSDPRLPGGAISPAAESTTPTTPLRTLIPAGATWRFLDSGIPPAADWTQASFADASWKSGPAEVGYGDGGESTVASYIDTDPATAGIQKNLTTWFRHRFTVANPAAFGAFALRLLCDDGAVVYLNGREILRLNLLTGPITPETRAIASVGGADEAAFTEFNLSDLGAILAPGDNLLAVEVHQNSPESSDISFDLELTAQALDNTPAPSLVLSRPTLFRARTRVGSDWSALAEAYLVPDSTPNVSSHHLALTEIHYHPADSDAAEFLEFFNPTAQHLDLSGCRLTNAVTYRFPDAVSLAPGETIVVARDPAAFESIHAPQGSPLTTLPYRLLGPWAGALSNSGETLGVVGADGTLLYECNYRTDPPWPPSADGEGSSLEWIGALPLPATPTAASRALSTASSWQASQSRHGSPGRHQTGFSLRGFESWLLSRLPAATPPALRLPEADADADGISNLAEYAFALSPTQADAPWLRAGRDPGTAHLLLEYRIRSEPVEFLFHLESSPDLVTWNTRDAEVIEVARTAEGTEALRVRVQVLNRLGTEPGATAARFFRISATPKP